MSSEGRGDGQDGLVDMSAGDVLAFAESRHAARLDAERDILRAAYQWAVLHSPDRLPESDKRRRERARPAGAEGTLLITEYAAATFGARIQTSPFGAKKLIAAAVDIHHRLPKLNAGISAGTTRVGHARHVAEATRELTPEQAAWVDAEVAEICDGRLGWKRFEDIVEGKVAAAAPELAHAKEEAAARQRGIRRARVNKHGMATLIVHGHAATVMGIEAGIEPEAQARKKAMPGVSIDEHRLAVLAEMTNPQNHPDPEPRPDPGPVKPKVKIYLHMTPDSPIARMEGHGPVTTAWVRHLIAHIAGEVRVTPVIDLSQQISVDAYEIPTKIREAVHLVHPGDVFPFATNTTRTMDLDHHHPYSEGGPTSTANLGPLGRGHHRIKTHGHWTVRQPFPGIIVWRDPHGTYYLVDATGTRKITGNSDPPAAA